MSRPRSGLAPPVETALVVAAACLYTMAAFALSAMQYNALHVPHGDTGMYEEHLWNVAHGKGFRSQLDDGRLFLGEHFEFIHLFLLPAYLIYPSLLTLNLFESAALASGSIAILFLARRLGVERAGLPLALSWFFYFPLQYLDFEITWKTFRPESFGVPLVLFALLAFESKRMATGLLLLLLSYTAKEDYAVVGASVGVYLLVRNLWHGGSAKEALAGVGLAAGSALFFAWVLLWFIPHFRGGEPHYVAYYQSLGDSPAAIAKRLVIDPQILIARATRPEFLAFLVLLLAPLGFLPLASPVRLGVTIPTLACLMLSDREELIQPWFHFHGPAVPVLFWATVAGVANLRRFVSPRLLGWIVFLVCVASGAWMGRSPASWRFYDRACGVPRWREPKVLTRPELTPALFKPEGDYWRDVYLPDQRSAAFEKVRAHVRSTDRVAATDYVRTRFTHGRAAHDYPTFRKHVTIDDIDVIVLDKTEGYWGRGETNPDQALLLAMRMGMPAGSRFDVRGRPFVIVYQDAYFLVVRRLVGH